MTDPTHRLDPADLLEHAEPMRRLAHRLVADAALADDLVQEAWAAALRTPPKAGVPLGPWLAAVVRNAASNLRRGRGRRAAREAAAARPEAGASLDDLVERAEGLAVVSDAVRRLPEAYREVVLLRHFDDAKPAEIARRLGIPVNTVRTRLARAHDSLRADLDRHFGGDGRSWALALVPYAALDARASVLSAASIPSSLGVLIVTHPLKSAAAAALLLILTVVGLDFGSAAGAREPERTASAPASVRTPVAEERPTPVQAVAPAARDVAARASIRGRVVDALGRPIPGATVQRRFEKTYPSGRWGYDWEDVAEPDAEGAFEFAADAEGAQTVLRASLPPIPGVAVRRRGMLEIPVERWERLVTEVEAVPGEPVELVAGRLRTVPLEVRVVDADGTPVPRFELEVTSRPASAGARPVQHLQEEVVLGPFTGETERFDGVPLEITVHAIGAGSASETLVPSAGGALELELTLDLDRSVREPDQALVRGTVVDADTGAPIGGVRLEANVRTDATRFEPGPSQVQTRTDGSFAVSFGRASAQLPVAGEPDGLLDAFHPWYEPAVLVPVTFGEPVELALRRRARLEVRVVDALGQTRPGVPLLVHGRATTVKARQRMTEAEVRILVGNQFDVDDAPTLRGSTGADGVATFEHLPAGRYVVHLLPEPNLPDESAVLRRTVEIEAGVDGQVELVLPDGSEAVVTGEVRGAPRGQVPTIPAFVGLHGDGGFTVCEPAGVGFRTSQLAPGEYAVVLMPAVDDFASDETLALLPRVKVGAGATQHLTLDWPTGRARGRLLGHETLGEGLRVVATPILPPGHAADLLDSGLRSNRPKLLGRPAAELGPDGTFTLEKCAEGPYRLELLDPFGRTLADRAVRLDGAGTVELGAWEL